MEGGGASKIEDDPNDPNTVPNYLSGELCSAVPNDGGGRRGINES